MSRAQLTILTNICLIKTLKSSAWLCSIDHLKPTTGLAMPFPGGHVEEGEAFAESVIREIYEETGLTIQSPATGWH